MNFEDYDNYWKPRRFDGFSEKVSEFCKNHTDQNVNLIKILDTNGGPGRVNFRLKGKITKDGRCGWIFTGEVTIDDDYYNFDARPYGERNGPARWYNPISWIYPKENPTRAEGVPGGTNYWIKFKGGREVELKGDCISKQHESFHEILSSDLFDVCMFMQAK